MPTTTEVRNTGVEKMLDDRGVSYELVEIDVSLIDVTRSQQNQARITSPLVQSTVETYTAALERGDEFPPMVVYKVKGREKYVVVDGNHRLMAYIGSEQKSVWVYVVDPSTPPELITILTYEANTKHGLPTSEAERARHAVFLIENAGETIKSAAARMNLSGAFLNRYYSKVRADNRAAGLGINMRRWSDLSSSVRSKIGTLKADEVYKALIEYALKARLTTSEIEELVSRLNKEGSVTEQLTILQREESNNQTRIQDVAIGRERPRQQMMAGPRRVLYNGWTHIESLKGDRITGLTESLTPLEAQDWGTRIVAMQTRLSELEEALKKRAAE